jgi:hypothetical protein
MVCVFSTYKEVEVGMLKGALDEQHIDNLVRNHFETGYGGGWDDAIKVYVREEDAAQALETVQALFGESEKEG